MSGTLVLLPGLTAVPNDDGTIVVTRKFHDGVLAKLEHWNGPLHVLMRPSSEESWNLDHLTVDPKKLPYRLEVLEYRRPDLESKLRGARVVLAMIGVETSDVSRICRRSGVPSIYLTEYTLRTRLQIARADEERAMVRFRRFAFEVAQERRNQQAIRIAEGLQCNGVPTYDAYRSLSPHSHLFFDSRLRASALVDEPSLEKRLASLDAKRPLQLVYSGRLDPMKGALFLPQIAHELRLMGVDFELTICGGGKLAEQLAADIRGLGLGKQVRMRGVLDFESELVPFIKGHGDVFLSPHIQGDPSCTYLETFGCGTPIVGFSNEAFDGFLRMSGVGWAVPRRDCIRAAEVIRRLDRDREQIKRASRAARAFALDHAFEVTMKRRIEHIERVCDRGGDPTAIARSAGGDRIMDALWG